jgi:hypothetical protein
VQLEQRIADASPPPMRCPCANLDGAVAQTCTPRATVRQPPLRPLWRPFWLRLTYVTSVLVKKY